MQLLRFCSMGFERFYCLFFFLFFPGVGGGGAGEGTLARAYVVEVSLVPLNIHIRLCTSVVVRVEI